MAIIALSNAPEIGCPKADFWKHIRMKKMDVVF